ncbi:MAG: YbaK/EbsC family protein [Nitrososphaerota archaeon]|nr:YbaK/EbsC family protein [Nitrososphaerales archaeon]MCX8191605.1 YbaK/EbsC family protein [Nitrososphaerales archaeon]MDW8045003.1 YbaK/EbsC family protein [Nitrososphaerota archaeon]
MDELQRYLEAHKIPAKLFEFDEHTMTVEAASQRIGVEPSRIIKTLVLIGDDTKPLIAILTGDKRLNMDLLAREACVKKIRLATPKEVQLYTGFEVGAVPPIAHKNPIPIYIDHKVTTYDKVIAGGGKKNRLMEITSLDIIKYSKGRVVKIGE